jgi:hypothetical protein
MYRLAVFLIPAIASSGALRYARMGDFDGKVEVQIQAADAWQPGLRNMPLPESTRLQTAADSHAEIELDESSVVRLAPETLLELSDYTRLSSGQRVTLLSLDHGMAYFTGQAGRQDALMLAVPGAQIAVQRGARVRIEARDNWSQIAVIEGKVRFSSPSAEMDLAEGEMARVDPANRARFYLYREISPYDTDHWSEERDKILTSSTSAAHVPDLHFGVQDLDSAGSWIETQGSGTVWKPKVADGWAPFHDGRWAWYDGLGYTWIAGESWGWLPYHYGRWMRTADIGWFWVPGRTSVFKPGDVYWLRGAKVAGWGPLAPAEDWTASGVPQLFLSSTTSWAEFAADARVIDPTGFTSRPKEPLAVASFTLALSSPAFVAARLEATRPPLRTGTLRIFPVISGVAYEEPSTVAQAPPPPRVDPPPPPDPVASAPPPVVIVPPLDQPVDIYYPVPVYTGVVIVNPPETTNSTSSRRRSSSASTTTPPPTPTVPTPRTPQDRPQPTHSPEPKIATHREDPKLEPHPPVTSAPPHPQPIKQEPPKPEPRANPTPIGGAKPTSPDKSDNTDRTASPRKN